MLVFELTMPNCGSWNGRWSQENDLHVLTVPEYKVGKKRAQELDGKSYSYHWEDGWTARVTVRRVDCQTARKLERKTRGFCGYDWMVKSIMWNDKIEP